MPINNADYEAGIKEGVKRSFDLVHSTIANSDNPYANEIREDMADAILEYAPEFETKWKEIKALQEDLHKQYQVALKHARNNFIKEMQDMTLMNDDILLIARRTMKQEASCCNVEAKTCSNDVWKGDIGAFSRIVSKLLIPKE